MATTSERPSALTTTARRWLWSVRGVTLLSMLLVIVPAVLGNSFKPFYGDLGFYYLHYWAALVLYVLIAGLLWAKPIKAGLALAMGTGAVGFVLSAGLFWVALAHFHKSDPKSYFALFALSQTALVATAIKAFRSSRREATDKATLTRGIGIPWISFVVFSLALAGLLHGHGVGYRQHWNGVMAVGDLREINNAQATYAETYKIGYSPSLLALGPSASNQPPSVSAASLIDSVVAGGRKHDYTYSYSPGPRNASGRITTYTVLARPVKFGIWEGTGTRDYFTDESGIIRWTSEDRPAIAKDPALPQ